MTKAYQDKHARCKKRITYQQALLFRPDPNFHYEVKESGCRYWFQVKPQGAKHNYLVSRRISKKTGLLNEKQDVETKMRDFNPGGHWGWWNDTVFDGEMRGGRLHNDTIHAMSEGTAHYVVWDITRLRGRDLTKLPHKDRWRILLKQVKFFPRWMRLIEHSDNCVSLLQKVIARKGEGLVRKFTGGAYGERWDKIKKEFPLDAVIWGYIETKSAEWAKKGWIGSVRLGQWTELPTTALKAAAKWSPKTKQWFPGDQVLHDGALYQFTDVGDCSGFTNAKREEISNNKKRFLGMVVEVEVSDVHDSGKFCDPRFSRERHDKSNIDCKTGEA